MSESGPMVLTEKALALQREVDEVAALIDKQDIAVEPQFIMQRMVTLTGYLARMSTIVADAKALRDLAKSVAAKSFMDSTLRAHTEKALIDGEIVAYETLYEKSSKIHDALKQTIETLRSQLSYLREELRSQLNG